MNAECHNTPGWFKCKCKQGFIGNGVFCTGNASVLTFRDYTRLNFIFDIIFWNIRFLKLNSCYSVTHLWAVCIKFGLAKYKLVTMLIGDGREI